MNILIENPTNRFWSLLILICCVLFYAPTPLKAQRKDRSRLKAYYEKLPNNDKKISIILTSGRGKSIEGVRDALITLNTNTPDSTIEMASLRTDLLGEAELFIEADYLFPKNEEGFSVIDLIYQGNDTLMGSDRQIEIRDLNLDLSLEIDDSLKYTVITAYTVDMEGNDIFIEGLKLKVGVKRLYNNLYLGVAETDEDGIANFEFPDDIPGDSTGMISVVVKLEDHDEFGTVTKIEKIEWGVPIDYSMASNGRSLFGDSAPIWMISSVAIILAGAWFHFLWATIVVFRIKKLA